jgi:serine/threonine protein kinase
MVELPSHLSSSLRSFLTAALTYDPVARPSAQQLLSHPWIQVGLITSAGGGGGQASSRSGNLFLLSNAYT